MLNKLARILAVPGRSISAAWEDVTRLKHISDLSVHTDWYYLYGLIHKSPCIWERKRVRQRGHSSWVALQASLHSIQQVGAFVSHTDAVRQDIGPQEEYLTRTSILASRSGTEARFSPSPRQIPMKELQYRQPGRMHSSFVMAIVNPRKLIKTRNNYGSYCGRSAVCLGLSFFDLLGAIRDPGTLRNCREAQTPGLSRRLFQPRCLILG